MTGLTHGFYDAELTSLG